MSATAVAETTEPPAAPQHLRALRQANHVRLARAALKRRIAEGEARVDEILAAPPPEARGMAICDLLCSQRRWGRTRCRKLLVPLAIPENKPIGSMTSRQRGSVIARLRARSEATVAAAPWPAADLPD